MAVETGHFPNRAFFDQPNGDLNLNGANFRDSANVAVAQNIGFTIAQGASSNIVVISIAVQDGAGTALANVFDFGVYLSDSAIGDGLTATTASGTVGAGTPGTVLNTKVSKKALEVLTDHTGVFQLSITDTSTTGFYIAVECPGTGKIIVSRQLVVGDYHA